MQVSESSLTTHRAAVMHLEKNNNFVILLSYLSSSRDGEDKRRHGGAAQIQQTTLREKSILNENKSGKSGYDYEHLK